jgi:hypothetical protein
MTPTINMIDKPIENTKGVLLSGVVITRISGIL